MFAAAALHIIVIVVDNVEGVVECGAVHGTGATGGDREDGLGWWRPGLATSASGSLAQPSSRAAHTTPSLCCCCYLLVIIASPPLVRCRT